VKGYASALHSAVLDRGAQSNYCCERDWYVPERIGAD
jgi:hypothetical protein